MQMGMQPNMQQAMQMQRNAQMQRGENGQGQGGQRLINGHEQVRIFLVVENCDDIRRFENYTLKKNKFKFLAESTMLSEVITLLSPKRHFSPFYFSLITMHSL